MQAGGVGLYVQGGVRQVSGEKLFDELSHEPPPIAMSERNVSVLHDLVFSCQ